MARYRTYKTELDCLLDPKHPKSATELAAYYEIRRLQGIIKKLTVRPEICFKKYNIEDLIKP